MTRRSRLAILAAAGVASAAAAAPQAAYAHGIVQRTSLPIPEVVFAWAAATVLVVSFVGLAVLWPEPRLQEPPWRPSPGALGRVLGSRVVEVLCAAIGAALFAIVVYAGYESGGSALDNLAPTFILIDFWVGLVFASVLFGDVFRAFSPWRASACAASAPTQSAGVGTPRRSRCSASPGSSWSRRGARRRPTT